MQLFLVNPHYRTHQSWKRRSWERLHRVGQGQQGGRLGQGLQDQPPHWALQAVLLSWHPPPHALEAGEGLPEHLPAAAPPAACSARLLPWPWQLPAQLPEQPVDTP